MFLFDYFWSFVVYLGLYKKSGKLVFLGLDNAGKTTLLHMLRDNSVASHQPTQRPAKEEMTIGNVNLSVFDLGGHEAARAIWQDYYVDASGIIFMVDTTDRGRFPTAKHELDMLLIDERLRNVPFAVLGNKIDLPTACSEQELRMALGNVQHIEGDGMRPINVFMCSVVRRSGYVEAFRWISKFI